MRENLTSVFERQGKDFATRAYPSLFKFLFLDELLCEKNAFAEMQKNFVALPPSSPVPDPTPTRKRKRKAEPIVAAALSTRKLRSSTSPTNFLDLESIEPSKRKKGSPSAKVGPGIANLGMTCYVASALQVAVSVSSWKEVMLIFQKNGLIFSLEAYFYDDQSRTRCCQTCRGVWPFPKPCFDSL